MMRRSVLLPALVCVGVVVVALAWPMRAAPRAHVDWKAVAAGPAEELSVWWVGHSLMNARDPDRSDARNLLERVGDLARSRGLAYESFDHTAWGASLSMLWRGSPHAHGREIPELAAQLAALLERGARFDALVLTERIPLEATLRYEHSAWYAQLFAAALRERNPVARVYVYECWSNLQASEPGRFFPQPSAYDWLARLDSDRVLWEQLADQAASGAAPAPGLLGRLTRWLGADPSARAGSGPVFLIPVGSVLRTLASAPPAERIVFRGRALRPDDLVTNPRLDWPAEWPLRQPLAPEAERARLASLRLRHPERALDDIHPTDLCVYIASLTHFATLYRRSPEGLPCDVEGLDAKHALALQQQVWAIVRADPRAGVAAP